MFLSACRKQCDESKGNVKEEVTIVTLSTNNPLTYNYSVHYSSQVSIIITPMTGHVFL